MVGARNNAKANWIPQELNSFELCTKDRCEEDYVIEHGSACPNLVYNNNSVITCIGSGFGRKSVEGGCEAADSRMAMELAPINKGQSPTDRGVCACANSYVQLDSYSRVSRRDNYLSCRLSKRY